ncbi:general substrate transporter [Zopfia rhizophila CBS 207.26]|uniref:General substrate transporter n=1 Tax=Zopfia rhizophila CBS 207.26 TaxID=1314779 RepID=A0A6A6ENF7_9PEZI|nr:general substrate transporter [Zopfia rhizophila CBS 207.26]
MGKALVVSCAVFSAIGGFLFGYDSGIISSTISSSPAMLRLAGLFRRSKKANDLFRVFGRHLRVCLAGGAVTIAMLIAGRLFAGIAVGQLSSIVPIYCAEIAPPEIRGMLSGLIQWMLSWGFFAAQWIGYGSTFSTSSFQWRFPLSFQCLPAVVLAIGIMFLPESPRWLMEKDRHEEARTTLRRLHYNGHNEEFLNLEFIEIQGSIHTESLNKPRSWAEIVTSPSLRRRLILGCGIQAFGQLSGINVINYYGPRIYRSLGINTSGALMITGINGTTGIIENTLILLIIDRIGRIWPITIGAFGMAACMLVNAVLNKRFPADAANPNDDALRAQVAMNFVFQLAFQSLGCISWIYPAEIFPTEIRALGASISALTNWCLNLLFAQCSPIALGSIGFNYFYFFFAFNFISGFCYIMFYPETKKRTLEEINILFGDAKVAPGLEHLDKATNEPIAKENKGILHIEAA